MSPPLSTFLGLVITCLIVALAILARSLFTPRAWWFLVTCVLALSLGIRVRYQALVLLGLVPLLWFLWQWLVFLLRVRTVVPRMRLHRALYDRQGPVRIFWADQIYQVELTVSLVSQPSSLLASLLTQSRLPYVVISDRIPQVCTPVDALVMDPHADGLLVTNHPLVVRYGLTCGRVGLVRFEGVRVQLADLQGFFYHTTFLRDPQLVRILPRLSVYDSSHTSMKRHNELPPPGMQRLRRPGSGSELLDLRDYLPGDPPRTIAWKISARRDRLITKEFESEVPIRCTLLVDTSQSVLLPTRQGTALQRLVEIAAAVLRSNADRRDLTGLILFNETGSTYQRPDRTSNHVHTMLQRLAEVASLTPTTRHADPDTLLPVAYSFAQEVYADLLLPRRNAMPWWLTWMATFPGNWRRPIGFLRAFYRRKLDLLWFALITFPFILGCAILVAAPWIPAEATALLVVVSGLLSGLLTLGVTGLVLVSTLISRKQRRLALWRKRLAAVLSVRSHLDPGGLAALLEDDDLFSLQLQQFLGEHQLPYPLPRFDHRGRYLFAAPEKIPVLTRALLQAVSRGRDNELFVLLADVLELEENLEPLLHAVRITLGRHHQVLLVCPWPPGLPLPDQRTSGAPLEAPPELRSVRLMSLFTIQGYQAAYARVRQQFSAMGVTVLCAAAAEPIPLILQRIDRLRCVQQPR